MDSDESWRDLFQRRVAEMDVPESRVVEVIAVAGARVRRRRRLRSAMPVVAIAATALAVAAITGTSYVLARPEAGTSSPAAAASPSAPPQTESAIITRLERILSATGQLSGPHRSTLQSGASVTWWRYDDGHGPAALTVVVERASTSAAAGWSCGVPTCTVQTRPDGSVLMTEKSPGDTGTYQKWTAKLGRPDGVVITLVEANSDEPKGAVTRGEPPLSTAQLSSIVIELAR